MDRSALAIKYAMSPAATITPGERSAFIGWLDLSYRQIADRVLITADELSPEDFLRQYKLDGSLLVTSANSAHPFWTVAENVRFRAVHDWHHILTGRRFDWAGELVTYDYACATAPTMIHWILRSEIAMQAAYAIETGDFAPQKLVR
jgi:hypothetical protein